MIVAVGNSHAHFFTNTPPAQRGYSEKEGYCFTSYSLNGTDNKRKIDGDISAPLAYTFYEKWLPILLKRIESQNLPITLSDTIVLVLGEIDCRLHLPRQVLEYKKDLNKAVEETVKEYVKVPIKLKELGYSIVMWGVHPSSNQGPRKGKKGIIPYIGDVNLRNKITKTWNTYLQQECQKLGLPFISIYDTIVNIDGTTNEKFYRDDCHLDTDTLYNYVLKCFNEVDIYPCSLK